MVLPVIWFFLLGILLAGYAVLDGFDLGVGILSIFARTEKERASLIDTIGPIWDGNEVWLVTFGGGLFAAFPEGYATLLSAFYIPAVLILVSLMFRAASLEFRTKFLRPRFRRAWDLSFFSSSLLAAWLFGIAVGNGIIGLPLNESGAFIGSSWILLRPYPLMVGLLAISLFMLHGSLYLGMRVPEPVLQARIYGWAPWCWRAFVLLYLATSACTLIELPSATHNFQKIPWAWALVFVNVLTITAIYGYNRKRKPGSAFIASAVNVFILILLASVAVWPNMVAASNNPANTVSIFQAASSQRTLEIMLLLACIGAPLMLTYSALIYWTFWRPAAAEVEVVSRG